MAEKGHDHLISALMNGERRIAATPPVEFELGPVSELELGTWTARDCLWSTWSTTCEARGVNIRSRFASV